jgi:hypothetical protein
MGGYNSGGWNATGRRTTAATWRLDVNGLNKAGALKPGWVGGWQWLRDGEQVANIGVRAEEGGVRLIYRSRYRGGEWTEHDEHVAVSWEPCRFGGRRPYFHCPTCWRRVLQLHGDGRYLCRTCQNLSYPSQRESPLDRAFRRADGIRVALGGQAGIANPFPEKPKGMHWRTYGNLRYRASMAVAEITAYEVRRFGLQLPDVASL